MSTTFSVNRIRYTTVPDDDARFEGVGPGEILIDMKSVVLRFNRLHLRALVRESEADELRANAAKRKAAMQ